jgi:hypothetical protein
MACYSLTIAPLLFTALTVCWHAIVVVVVVAATSADADAHFLRVLNRIDSPAATIIPTSAFVVPYVIKNNFGGAGNTRQRHHHHHPLTVPRSNPIQYRKFSMSSDDPNSNNSYNNNNPFNDDEPNNNYGKKENDDSNKNNNNNSNMVVIDELSWRAAKVRLEEANTKRLLNHQPLKMSYLQSRQFIQRNWGPIRTRKEFEDLVLNGDLKTPYISKRPEEYYGKRGEWISWEHYLLGDCSVASSSSSSTSICGSSGSSDGNSGSGGTNSNDTDASGGRSQNVVLKWQ